VRKRAGDRRSPLGGRGPRIAATLALAAVGGVAARALGAPLPWLLGSLLATAAAVVLAPGRSAVLLGLPPELRLVFVPVIGVAIGATVSPEVVRQAVHWWPTLLAVLPFVIGVQLLNYAVLRRIGGFDRPTAYFAASPGGLVEAVLIGERRGGRTADMAMQHFCRIAITVAVVPLLATAIVGAGADGSAAAAPRAAAPWPPLGDVALLVACGLAGALLARRLRLPAAIMIGPFLCCAAVQATGITAARVPGGLVALAQVVVGASLGLRFAGMDRRRIRTGLGLSCLCVAAAVSVATLLAFGFASVSAVSAPAIFLAFSPGGVAEMGLVAVSLALDPAFVAMHHLLRIVLAILVGPLIFDRLVMREAPGPVAEAASGAEPVPPERDHPCREGRRE
jgi:hypothetical protein